MMNSSCQFLRTVSVNSKPFNRCNVNFFIVWADNADALSIPYSGTGALKTDFTRTGTRTRMGLVNDFNNSAIRYIKNNYMDGSRQDGIDLILGKYRVSAEISPFSKAPSSLLIKTIPLIFLMALALFFMILFSPESFVIESSLIYISTLSFSFAIVVTCWLYIQQNGSDFVDWPKLIPIQPVHIAEEEPTSQIIAVQKVTDAIQKWKGRRDSTAILNEAEQGFELLPTTLKKTT